MDGVVEGGGEEVPPGENTPAVRVEVGESPEGEVGTICPFRIHTPLPSRQQVEFWLPQQTLWSGQKVIATPPLLALEPSTLVCHP